ncbi:unnamed protein product [Owenia fusiformis]|uniref:Uncharacterized protein n=1 Tax=Owenia fusiformis TaxID=6347 RepID=A0A8J1U3N0_OWEFU|nr:unnamed protein product [Owenia fusiformis]
MTSIPTLDCSNIAMNLKDEEISVETLKEFGQNLFESFQVYGCAVLVNHGVCNKSISDAWEANKSFNSLGYKEKMQYEPGQVTGFHNMHGYQAMGKYDGPIDIDWCIRESFRFVPTRAKETNFNPDDSVPGYTEAFTNLWEASYQLAKRLLTSLTFPLAIKNQNYFTELFEHIHTQGCNATGLRGNGYQAVPEQLKDDKFAKSDRFTEHTDKGMFTVLYQDVVSGLQVQARSGAYIVAKHVPGSILVQVGEILQRVTADKIPATPHKVVVTEEQKKQSRHSLAYFLFPDKDQLLTCFDGSDTYPPIRTTQMTDTPDKLLHFEKAA